jgi:CRP-like cAMP-binding protein
MDILWSNIFRKNNAGQNGMLDILKSVPIFRDLNDRELRKIERLIYVRSFKKDETIFRQGEPGLGMYIVESGRVLILLAPHAEPLAELSEGEFFGELSLLDEAPRSASAVAVEETKLLCFFHPELMDLLNVDPKLGLKLVIGLARTIGERTKKAAEYISVLKNNPEFGEEYRVAARKRIADLA